MWAASRRRAASIAARAGAGMGAPLGATPLQQALPPLLAHFQPQRRANVVGGLVKAAQIYRALQGQKP